METTFHAGGRLYEDRWVLDDETGDGVQTLTLTTWHSPTYKQFQATLKIERVSKSGWGEVRSRRWDDPYANLAREPVARYSERGLALFRDEVLAGVKTLDPAKFPKFHPYLAWLQQGALT